MRNLCCENEFICIIIKSHFHINGFALSLTLKVRFFGTRKWPIEMPVHRLSMYVPEKDPGTFKEVDLHTVNSSATSLRVNTIHFQRPLKDYLGLWGGPNTETCGKGGQKSHKRYKNSTLLQRIVT